MPIICCYLIYDIWQGKLLELMHNTEKKTWLGYSSSRCSFRIVVSQHCLLREETSVKAPPFGGALEVLVTCVRKRGKCFSEFREFRLEAVL